MRFKNWTAMQAVAYFALAFVCERVFDERQLFQ